MITRTRYGRHQLAPYVVVALPMLVGALLTSCGPPQEGVIKTLPVNDFIPLPKTAHIPAGPFIAGSTIDERERAYRLDEAAYGDARTRAKGCYDQERERITLVTHAFRIMQTPVTNQAYASFVDATGHPAPDVDEATWRAYGLSHPYGSTRRHAWVDGRPPAGRERHPVVLVSHSDAEAYAAWLSETTGDSWRLPTEEEWEKAARGVDGLAFPWGDEIVFTHHNRMVWLRGNTNTS